MEYRSLAQVGVLGILNEKGAFSQEKIVTHLQHNFSKYWGFSSGVLSPVVADLEEENYISTGKDKAENIYVYRITLDGKEYLHDLIREPFERENEFNFSNREHVLIRLGFLHHLPEGEQSVILDWFENQLIEERERWTEILHSHEDEYMDLVQAGYRRDLIELNINMLNALLNWVKDLNIRTLE